MWIMVAGLAGAAIGVLMALQLRTLRYRRPDEQNQPRPKAAWWLIPAATAASWAWLTWHLTNTHWTALVLWLALTATLGWLTVVDLDVRRLPNNITLPAGVWVTLLLIINGITTGSPHQALAAAAVGAAAGLGAWILHIASRGGLGFGDVKLITILGAALALIHPRLVLPALLAASIIGILTALITHRREFEFGPSLAIGSILAIGLQATIN